MSRENSRDDPLVKFIDLITHLHEKKTAIRRLTLNERIKKPSAVQGRRVCSVVPPCLLISNDIFEKKPLRNAITGDTRRQLSVLRPPASWVRYFHRRNLPEYLALQASSTFTWRSRGTLLGSHLALPTRCWIVYYSCVNLICVC